MVHFTWVWILSRITYLVCITFYHGKIFTAAGKRFLLEFVIHFLNKNLQDSEKCITFAADVIHGRL